MEVTFSRKLSVDDYLLLRRAAGFKDICRAQAKTGLGNSLFKLAAKADGRTVGMLRVVGDGGYVMLIVDVTVLPEFRNRGIATKMMNICMNHIHENMGERHGVMVQLMAAKGLERFYEKFGFTARPTESLGPGMTQWIEDM